MGQNKTDLFLATWHGALLLEIRLSFMEVGRVRCLVDGYFGLGVILAKEHLESPEVRISIFEQGVILMQQSTKSWDPR